MFMIPLDYSKDLRRLLAEGKTQDEALTALRTKGLSIIECIIAVQKFRRCDLAEAKEIVHFSPAWADMREQHEKFHRELEEIANEIEKENT
jgi:hypothetical protein